MIDDKTREILQSKFENHESMQVKVVEQVGVGFVVDALGQEGFIRYYLRYYYPGDVVDVIPCKFSAFDNLVGYCVELEFATLDYYEVQEAVKESKLKDGDLLAAEVINVDKEQAFVKIDGISCELPIFKSELAVPAPKFAYDVVHVGDRFLVYVVQQYRIVCFSSNEGNRCKLQPYLYISKNRADSIGIWREMENNSKESKAITAEITSCISRNDHGKEKGLCANVKGLKGFIPIREIDIKPVYDLVQYVNKKLQVIPIEVDTRREVLILSGRAFLKQEQKRKEERKKQEEEKRQKESARQTEEKRKQILLAQERNPFAISKFIPVEESVIARLNIYDGNINLYLTQNWFFVADQGLKEMLPLRQITRVSLHWYDENEAGENISVYGNKQNTVVIDIFNVNNTCLRFYVPEDLSSSVIDFIKAFLQREGRITSLPAVDTKAASPTPRIIEKVETNDDIWN